MSESAAAEIHPPFFIPTADGSDPLMTVALVTLIVIAISLGVGYFWLHSLPERMAHKAKRAQMQVVAVFCLIALFTHIQLFWLMALILAMIDFPDFSAPARRMAAALEAIASGRNKPAPADKEAES